MRFSSRFSRPFRLRTTTPHAPQLCSLQPQAPSFKPPVSRLQPPVLNPQSTIRNPQSAIRNPHSLRSLWLLAAFCAAFLLFALLATRPAQAADTDGSAVLSTEKPSKIPFALDSPAIIKADWESTLLRAGDFNGDGRADFLTVNNTKNLLLLYLQNPPKEKQRFTRREEILDFSVSSVVTEDFNGDGKTDIALASPNRNILLRSLQADGALGPALSLDVPALFVETADLDGDGNADLVALAEDKTTLLYGPLLERNEKQRDSRKAAPPVSFFNAATPGSRPLLGDVDGNGLDDVMYLDSQRRNRVLVRLQVAPRQWGLESAIEITNAADLTLLRAVNPNRKKQEEDRALLATVDSTSREVRAYRLGKGSAGIQEPCPLDGPYYLSYDPTSLTGRESVVAADLRGTGTADIVTASEKAAEIILYLADKEGRLASLSAPSLSNITALAVVPRKGGDLVFSLSGKEETIGASVWDPVRGLTVPVVLDAPSKPLVMAAGDLDGSGQADLLYLFKDADGKTSLAAFLNPTDPQALPRKPDVVEPLPVEADFEPVEMSAADINQDGRCDLIVFQKYNPVKLLLRKEDGSFAAFATDQGMKKGVFNQVRPGQILIADLDGDGNKEMLIARDNLARAYRLQPDGELRLIEQFNGKNASASIAAATAADLDGDAVREIALLDTGNQVMTIYKPRGEGKYQLVRHHDMAGVRASRLLAVDVSNDKREDLLCYAEDRLQLLYARGKTMSFSPVWRRVPEEKDDKYTRVFALDLLRSGRPRNSQLAALEATDHILEFFTGEDGAGLAQMARFFHFKVFDDESSVTRSREAAGRQEPRDLVAVDVNGDGLQDLATLAHDNIVYYLQRKP